MSEAIRVQSEQKLAIFAEAAPAEAQCVVDIEGGGANAGDHVRRLFTAFGAGSFEGSTTQLYVFRTPSGAVHFYAQPFDGRAVLPGEHHLVLPVGVPAPAVWLDGFGGGNWKSPHPAFEKWLKGHAMQRIVLDASWDWRLGAGSVKRHWLVQMRPLGDGRTHLAMKATGERAVSEIKPVGFATLTKMVLSLAQQPPPRSPPQAAASMIPSAYEAMFGALCESGQPLPVLARADLNDRDLGPAIHGLLAPHAGGKLFVHPVPPAKEASARREVMPRAAAHLPIVALLDLTLMGSASEAVVLTPTHCFVREGDVRGHFAWAEVRGGRPITDDRIGVLLAERGWIAVPVRDRSAAFAALCTELSRIP